MLSIIIPSRNEQFLTKTVLDLLEKAKGEVEVIVILDGYWETPVDDKRVTYIHRGKPLGMRAGINAGVAISKGEYIMKIDAHCMVGEGYDEILANDCEKDWVSIPRRYRLDPENWCIDKKNSGFIDYLYITYPSDPKQWGGAGLSAKLWDQKNKDKDLRKVEIDDLMGFQGSCWFMHRDYFYELELMDHENYGPFLKEPQEIGFKCWLSGGRVIRNKKTWYAHLHKGKKYGRGYYLSNRENDSSTKYTNKWITNSAWDKQTKPFEWIIKKFSTPGWDNVDFDNIIVGSPIQTK